MLQPGDLPGDFAHSGFRIPMVVISPWVNPHYVSHVWRDYTSIQRLIEDRFNVAPLTARDAAADNMSEFFDFTSPHLLTPPAFAIATHEWRLRLNQEKAPGDSRRMPKLSPFKKTYLANINLPCILLRWTCSLKSRQGCGDHYDIRVIRPLGFGGVARDCR